MKCRFTECFAPSSAKLFGAIAFVMLIASGGLSFGVEQPQSTSIAAIRANGAAFVAPEPADPNAQEPVLVLTITDSSWGNTVNHTQVSFFDTPTSSQESDRILFANNANNQATISFLSDDQNGNLPLQPNGQPYPTYPDLMPTFVDPQWAYDIFTIPAANGGGFLEVDMLSDLHGQTMDPVLGPASDGLFLQVVPEPSSVLLAGFGLASMVGIAYRRARRARV